MEDKTCTMCNMEKHINNFYKTYSECKDCNCTRGLKFYYKNKDKISNQQKLSYEKNRRKHYYKNKTINGYNLKT